MQNFIAIAEFLRDKDGLPYQDECLINLPMISGLSIEDSLDFWQEPEHSEYVNTLVAETVYGDYHATPVGYIDSEGQRVLWALAIQ